MAWTVTARGATEFSWGADGDVGDTFTPSENDIICVAVTGTADAALNAVTGWGATWYEVGTWQTAYPVVTLWAARMGASPGSSVVNVDITASTQVSCIVFQIAGADTTATVEGVGAGKLFLQAQSTRQYNPSSPMSITALSSFGSSTNLSLTLCGIPANNAFTPQSGWTEAEQASLGTVAYNVAAMYKAAEDTSHTVEGDLFNWRYVTGVALEMAEASSSPTTSLLQMLNHLRFSGNYFAIMLVLFL